jgi:hypothetical protein
MEMKNNCLFFVSLKARHCAPDARRRFHQEWLSCTILSFTTQLGCAREKLCLILSVPPTTLWNRPKDSALALEAF